MADRAGCSLRTGHHQETSDNTDMQPFQNCLPLLVRPFLVCGCLTLACLASPGGKAAERIAYQTPGGELKEIVARAIVTAQDGGQMVVTDDGRMLIIQPEWILTRSSDDQPLVPVDAEEAGRRLLAEMSPGFSVYRTKNYVIVHNSNDSHIRWVGGLFEALHLGFHRFFKNQGWDLAVPEYPLVALVFADRASFEAYARPELGDMAAGVIGYYNLETNRMTTFNVPNAERNVATIIHEATHQLAYNTGLQTRFADNPMWVSEGLAMFFEAPNFNNPSGWRGIGRINTVKFTDFQNYVGRRPSESLATLLSDDSRFRNSATARDAYAEAWALTYYLLKTKKKSYIKYLRALSQGKPLVERGRRERIDLFEKIFEVNLATLDRDFINYMGNMAKLR